MVQWHVLQGDGFELMDRAHRGYGPRRLRQALSRTSVTPQKLASPLHPSSHTDHQLTTRDGLIHGEGMLHPGSTCAPCYSHWSALLGPLRCHLSWRHISISWNPFRSVAACLAADGQWWAAVGSFLGAESAEVDAEEAAKEGPRRGCHGK